MAPKCNLEFDPCKIAFEAVRLKISTEILEQNMMIPLSLLKDVYIRELNHNGVNSAQYRSEKLKRRIENEFGESVGFYFPPNRTGYLSYKADKSQFLDMLDKVRDDFVQSEENTETEGYSSTEDNLCSSPHKQEISYLDILHCALFIRKLVKSLTNRIPWPPQICNLLPERSEEIIPDCLYNLLLWIIEGYETDNEDIVPLNKKTESTIS